MNDLVVFSEAGSEMNINCIYYYSNNNYFLIYTTKELDENRYVVLHLSKIISEIDSSTNTPSLVAIELTDDDEWKKAQSDISLILEDKKKKTNTAVHYLDSKNLTNLKIRGSRTFRLRPDIMSENFGIEVPIPVAEEKNETISNEQFEDYKTKYLEQLNIIKELETDISEYKQKISNIKKILES